MVAKAPKAVTNPDAWIVTNNQKDKSKPSDRGRKSIKSGKVYLDDGEDFEIELYNPLQECVLCDIKLGQRFYLDCFIDDKKKFIFNTYEIESSLESISATQKNGMLEVFFYKESVITLDNWKERFVRYYPVHHYYPYYDPYYYPYRGGIYGSGNIGTATGTVYGIGNCTTNLSSINIGTTTNCNTSYTSDSLSVNSLGNTFTCNTETGRVEKGSSSSQKFTEIDMEFESNFISSTILHLLPNSLKPVETKDINPTGVIDLKGVVKVNGVHLKDVLKRESDDIIELIKKLADLHSAGILTDEEFKSKKAELLSKI